MTLGDALYKSVELVVTIAVVAWMFGAFDRKDDSK